MQSLKDIQSKRLTSLKVDGYTRVINGTFSSSGGNITGLPVGHGIEINDRVSLSYTSTATQVETGLVGVSDITIFEPNLYFLKIDKNLSQFSTINDVRSAFTANLLISFQDDILSGATIRVKNSSLLGGVTAIDGDNIGVTGFWIVCVDASTKTGFPTIATYPNYTDLSAAIPVYEGVSETVNLTNKVVSALPTSTSITISGGIVDISSFTDLTVTKHSRIVDTLVTDNVEASSLKVNGSPVESNVVTVPYSGTIDKLKIIWTGFDDSGQPISSDTAHLGEINPTDPFNIGVDIDLIQLLTHPIRKDIGIMLYKNLNDNLFYLKAFKYTYDNGFDNSYTPYLINGADSNDIRMSFATSLVKFQEEIEDSPALIILGGKDNPGNSIYAAVVSIDTTNLTFNTVVGWGDTGLQTTSGNFTGIKKITDIVTLTYSGFVVAKRLVCAFNNDNLAYFSYDSDTNTLSLTWDCIATDYGGTNSYVTDYHGTLDSTILAIKENTWVVIGGGGLGTEYNIPRNSYSIYKKLHTGIEAGYIMLSKVERYVGIGSVTYSILNFNNPNLDPSTRQISSAYHETFPANLQNTSGRNQNLVFEIGDKIVYYKSFGYYVIVEKSSGEFVYLGTSLSNENTLYKSDDFDKAIVINDSTILYYKNNNWVANKILINPEIAYKTVDGYAYIAQQGDKINTPYTLSKGKTYYWSYVSAGFREVDIVSTSMGFIARRLGKAIGSNTFVVDKDFRGSPAVY